jgi:hypothetical protein
LPAALVLLGGGYGRAVLRPGQFVGQDFSLVIGVASAWQRCSSWPAAASNRWWTGVSTSACDVGLTTSTRLESERITASKENR